MMNLGNQRFRLTPADPADPVFALELFDGAWRFAPGGVTASGFAESTAITQKLRLHRSVDMLECSAEWARRIPFGCEFTIKRTLDLAEGFGRMNLDVLPEASGAIASLDLEPVILTGRFARVGLLLDGASEYRWFETSEAPQIIYDQAVPPLVVTAEGSGKEAFDFGCGADLWRHQAGNIENAESRFTVSISEDRIEYTRRLFALDDEHAERKRPWRLKTFFAWHKPGDVPKQEISCAIPSDPASVRHGAQGEALDQICFAAPSMRRKMRALVRGTQNNIVLGGANPGVCFDAAHLERPGKQRLAHFDFCEYIDFYVWANRRLRERGLSLSFASDGAGFAASAAFRAMNAGKLGTIDEYNP